MNVLATGQGHDASEVDHRRTAFIPHPQEELHRQRMHLVVIEEERLEGRKRRIWTKKSVQKLFQIVIFYQHPGAKIAQCSDRSSTISFEARAIGHRLSGGRLICSVTTVAK